MSLDRWPRHELGWPLKQVAPDRVVLTDDDREMCATCGEMPANSVLFAGRCRRCAQAIEDERERDW